jgi:putative copper resistance protein D
MPSAGALLSAAVPPSGPWTAWFAWWSFDPLTLGLLLAVGSAYAAGLVRLRREGVPWPGARVGWFGAGLSSLAVALLSPVETYAEVSFTVHMAQHLVLTVVAPPMLALGAPIALALRASRPSARRRLVAALRGRPAGVLANPVVGFVLFVGTPFALHLSPIFDLALRSVPVHVLEHAIWLISALIYWWPIVGRDPSPHPMGYPARLLSLFLVTPATSFLALALSSADRPLYPTYAAVPPPWGPNALADQQAAAALMWLVGGLAFLVAMLVVAVAWKRDDEARQRRLEETDRRVRATAVS